MVDQMTKIAPTDRLYVQEALRELEKGTQDLTHADLNWRLQPRDERIISLMYNDARAASRHAASYCRT
jgi:hypothetical protein